MIDFDFSCRKWFYLQHRFLSADFKTIHCIAISKLVLKHPSGKTLPFASALDIIGFPINEERRIKGMNKVEGLVGSEEAFFAV